MRNKSILIIIISLLVIIFHEYILVMGYMCYLTAKHIVIDVVPETFNRIVYIKNNNEAYDKYIESKYGIISKTFEMHNDGRFYYISTPFLKNEFVIQLTHGKVVSDRFYDILLTDSKFQHLYSEWVKKQVGIDDENIEINFKEALKGSRWVGEKPYIEFSNINSIDDLEEDICKNTHNLYVYKVEISNFNSLNVEDVLTVVKRYERLLKPYVFSDGDNVLWFRVKLNDSINDKDDPYRYAILFDYNNNEKKYYKYYEKRPIENNKSAYIEFD